MLHNPQDSALFGIYEGFGTALTRQDWAAAALHVNIKAFRAVLPGPMERDYSHFRAEVVRQMTAFPEFGERLKYVDVAVGPNLLIVHYVTDPTHSGELHGWDGRMVEPIGERVVIRGVDVVRFKDSRIVELSVFTDWRHIHAQLSGQA